MHEGLTVSWSTLHSELSPSGWASKLQTGNTYVFCLTVHYLIDHTLKLQKKMSLFGYWARVLYCKLQIPVIKKWMDVTWMLFYFFHYVLFIINVSELILNYCSELLKIWRTIYAFFICIAAVLFFFLLFEFPQYLK